MSDLLAPFAPLAILPNGEAVRPDEVSRVLIEAVASLVEEAGERFAVEVHLTDGSRRVVATGLSRPTLPTSAGAVPARSTKPPGKSDDVAARASAAGSAAGSRHRHPTATHRRSRPSRPSRRQPNQCRPPSSGARPRRLSRVQRRPRRRGADQSGRRHRNRRAEARCARRRRDHARARRRQPRERGGADRAAMRRAEHAGRLHHRPERFRPVPAPAADRGPGGRCRAAGHGGRPELPWRLYRHAQFVLLGKRWRPATVISFGRPAGRRLPRGFGAVARLGCSSARGSSERCSALAGRPAPSAAVRRAGEIGDQRRGLARAVAGRQPVRGRRRPCRASSGPAGVPAPRPADRSRGRGRKPRGRADPPRAP